MWICNHENKTCKCNIVTGQNKEVSPSRLYRVVFICLNTFCLAFWNWFTVHHFFNCKARLWTFLLEVVPSHGRPIETGEVSIVSYWLELMQRGESVWMLLVAYFLEHIYYSGFSCCGNSGTLMTHVFQTSPVQCHELKSNTNPRRAKIEIMSTGMRANLTRCLTKSLRNQPNWGWRKKQCISAEIFSGVFHDDPLGRVPD